MDEYRLACQSRRPLLGASTVMTRLGTRHTYEFAILPLRKGGEDIAQVIALEDHFGYQSAKMDLPPWKIGEPGAPLL
jgi:hypothetical protein